MGVTVTYVDKPHSERYTGRGMHWARKPIRQRRARKIARYQAGLIIDAAINDGWRPGDLVRRYGEDGCDEITKGLAYYAAWLIATGHPDGSGS